MKTYLLLMVLIISHKAVAQSLENKEIGQVLLRVENQIKKINTISYHADYQDINPTREDSIYNVEGKIWLKRNDNDSIFGAVFHVKGKDRGAYDYYYDGSKGYEIRHKRKAITVLDPYKFENNANNPAKARTALLPLIHLLTDTDFIKNLKHDDPIIEIIEKENYLDIEVQYPVTEHGSQLTKQLTINRNSYQIEAIKQRLLWNRMMLKVNIKIDSIVVNDQKIEGYTIVQKAYPDYTVKEFEKFSKKRDSSSVANFIGQTAKDFQFPTYDDELLSLKDQRGKYVLLDFWESWCGYCLFNIPKLQKIQEKYGQDELTIIGVTTENKKQIEKIIQKTGLTYSNIFAEQAILKDYEIQARPTYFLIDKSGLIIEHTFGNLDKIIDRFEEVR